MAGEDDGWREALEARFGGGLPDVSEADERDLKAAAPTLTAMAARRSHRRYSDRPVSLELMQTLAAVALSAASKSDMQQRDIVIVDDPDQLAALKACVAEQAWTAGIPRLLVFCGNNRRQRRLHQLTGHPFVNDHLDAFFNAAVDAGIAMQAFMTAAEAVGLGCCPISAIRNHPDDVSAILALPDHVFPVAGLAVGWPAGPGRLSYRLPLAATVHVDRHDEAGLDRQIADYDARRVADQPFGSQRDPERFGALPAERYTWSEDKTRQYAAPERTGFGAFVVKKGFRLD